MNLPSISGSRAVQQRLAPDCLPPGIIKPTLPAKMPVVEVGLAGPAAGESEALGTQVPPGRTI